MQIQFAAFFDEAVNDIVMARSTYNARARATRATPQDNIYSNNTSLLVDARRCRIARRMSPPPRSAGSRRDDRGGRLDQKGLTGLWYDPTTSGQGFGLEIFPDMTAVGIAFRTWFTCDASAAGRVEQRWYTFSGPRPLAFRRDDQIYENDGGSFAPPLRPQGCWQRSATWQLHQGRLTYAFTDGSGREGIIR
jgi:hypothetical protein